MSPELLQGLAIGLSLGAIGLTLRLFAAVTKLIQMVTFIEAKMERRTDSPRWEERKTNNL